LKSASMLRKLQGVSIKTGCDPALRDAFHFLRGIYR
jgi:hypothetical protein